MNEQLQQALIAIINKTMSGVDAGVSFLSAEIPEVIHQLLIWKMVESLLGFIAGVLLIIGTIWFVYKHTRQVKVGEYSIKPTFIFDSGGDVHPGIIGVVTAALCTLGFGFAGLTNLTWLQIWLAPKLFLVEYAASLVK